jgi:hypothetical protein
VKLLNEAPPLEILGCLGDRIPPSWRSATCVHRRDYRLTDLLLLLLLLLHLPLVALVALAAWLLPLPVGAAHMRALHLVLLPLPLLVFIRSLLRQHKPNPLAFFFFFEVGRLFEIPSLMRLVVFTQLLLATVCLEQGCRDRFLEPFSSYSIWNTAIGSSAEMAPGNLFGKGRLPSQFHNDQDFFLRVTKEDPLTDWINQGDWGSDDHCQVTGKVMGQIRFPRDWSSASDCNGHTDPNACLSKPNQANNNAMGVLLEDNETIVQMQPAYRCHFGDPLLARFGNKTDGCPQQFPNITSVFGDGNLGSHGGSGLSGIGGTIRLGELLGPEPIPHAIKIELQHQWYYGKAPLAPASAYNGGRRQYIWPATGSDSGTNKAPGGLYTGTDPHVAPGSLMALPAHVAETINMTTTVGKKIKQALVDYGAYIVDDTGGGNSVAICMEAQVNDEMRKNYGYAMTYPHGVSNAISDKGRALYSDLLIIFQSLHAVTNNGPNNIGGGGTPRVPTKPTICGAPPTPPLTPAPPSPPPTPPPPTPPPPPAALCQIKITGTCKKYPQESTGDWFDDSKKGGPPATTSIACCSVRVGGWKHDCPSCQVDCKFTPAAPGV